MDISIIIFTGIIVCGIAGIPLILKGIHKLIKDFFHYQEKQENKEQIEKINEVKEEIKKITESGTLADLINASKQLGDLKRNDKN